MPRPSLQRQRSRPSEERKEKRELGGELFFTLFSRASLTRKSTPIDTIIIITTTTHLSFFLFVVQGRERKREKERGEKERERVRKKSEERKKQAEKEKREGHHFCHRRRRRCLSFLARPRVFRLFLSLPRSFLGPFLSRAGQRRTRLKKDKRETRSEKEAKGEKFFPIDFPLRPSD